MGRSMKPAWLDEEDLEFQEQTRVRYGTEAVQRTEYSEAEAPEVEDR